MNRFEESSAPQNANNQVENQATGESAAEISAETTALPALESAGSEARGVGARFIVGFAAAGLLLAGVVGVWTLQSTSETAQAKQDSAARETAIESVSDSPDAETTSAESTSSRPEAAGTASASPAQPGTAASTLGSTQLTADPFLPPNAWSGRSSTPAAEPQVPTSVAPGQPSVNPVPTTVAPQQPGNLPPLPSFPIPTDILPTDVETLLPSPSQSSGVPTPTVTTTELPENTETQGSPMSANREANGAARAVETAPTDTTR
ncbi:hypothetical protein [Corynebacterium suicordis]|uniref:Uncharacterized protein n=1 Tax=Corynebacterium suicordis DSM 45110 TaxID=1121369 RepID=A0ABR9ZJ60_9CORY|nr:hypothetical protein [Corynebacterium suicordis]MBF4553028.1 hypothetical protein [Corynebacterium suicordis DSM 45110]MDR6278010.1 cytoskeletal protein RodZ [Corynebacterium suicordis]